MGKSILSFFLVILIIAGLIFTAVFGITIGDFEIPSVMDEENGIRKGLDLVGGSSITYEPVLEGLDISEQEIQDGLDSSIAIIQARLTKMQYTEATVQKSGDRKIVVEIPAVTNPEEAVKLLGSTGKLEFKDSDGNVILDGMDVKDADYAFEPTTQNGAKKHIVKLTFKPEGVSKFSEATKAASQKAEGKNYIAITLDDSEVSTPRVQNEITSETCIIEGDFTVESAKQLSDLIKGGQMPFSLKEVQLRSVGPTLGEKALETSIFAGLLGIALIMIFMIIVYRLPGIVASIALACYTALVAVILAVFKVNLSLPGIAGIILGIGMAVDANVIIFERIKEELRLGKTVGASVNSGFKRAFTAIIDSNVTTLIAAVVLWNFGTGTVVGFAQTLFIGVLVSMFTAVFVSRFLLKSLVGMNVRNIKAYGA